MHIPKDSPLKRIPENTKPKEALFLDGLNHAAEIVMLAFPRLLKSLASVTIDFEASPALITSCYLDAWTCVDAIDRFRLLIHQCPKDGIITRSHEIDDFIAKTQSIRKVRNVADHLNAQIDLLVSKKKSAMGELAWIQRDVIDFQERFFTWYIKPGYTGKSAKFQLLIPKDGQKIDIPIGMVFLYSGASEANLSAAYADLLKIVLHLENSLAAHFKKSNDAYILAHRDIVGRAELNMHAGD